MGAKHRLVRVGNSPDEVREKLLNLVWRAVTNRVWQVDGRGATRDRRLYDPAQEIEVAPCRILGGKLDIVSKTSRE